MGNGNSSDPPTVPPSGDASLLRLQAESAGGLFHNLFGTERANGFRGKGTDLVGKELVAAHGPQLSNIAPSLHLHVKFSNPTVLLSASAKLFRAMYCAMHDPQSHRQSRSGLHMLRMDGAALLLHHFDLRGSPFSIRWRSLCLEIRISLSLSRSCSLSADAPCLWQEKHIIVNIIYK